MKKIVRTIHLWLGLATGLIVFIVSITGCLYVFEEEIREATQHDRLYVRPEDKSFVGLDRVISNFERIAPQEKLRVIRMRESVSNATVQVSTQTKTYFFNPYNAELVFQGEEDWLNVVEDLHTSLLLGETGKMIQRWSVVIFGILLITGIILWFPRQMRLVRQSLMIKRKVSAKRLTYDLHQVLGFYASWFLLISVATGLFFAFKEVKLAAAYVAGSKLADGKVMKGERPSGIRSTSSRYAYLYQKEAQRYPGMVSSTFSVRKTGELRLRLTYPYRGTRKQNTFYFEASTGLLLRAKLFKDFNRADRTEASNYELHTGRFFGMPGKIVAFLASLISASLPVTGFMIWINRRKKRRRGSKKETRPRERPLYAGN